MEAITNSQWRRNFDPTGTKENGDAIAAWITERTASKPRSGPVTTDAAAANQTAADEKRRRSGSSASVLTTLGGVSSSPVSTKTLLGG